MRRLGIAFTSGVLAFGAMAGTAIADKPAPTAFVAVLDTDQETTTCPKSNSARGLAVFHVTDEAAGTVEWSLVANNLPGNITAAHIHLAPKGIAGGVVQPLPPTPGEENGVIGTGSFTNPGLLAAIRANESLYYVNVHTTTCPGGAIRGQLGDHGP